MQRRAGGSAVDAMQGACRCLRVQCSNDSGGTMPNVHGCLILCQWRAGSIATPQACPRLGPPFQPASSRPAGPCGPARQQARQERPNSGALIHSQQGSRQPLPLAARRPESWRSETGLADKERPLGSRQPLPLAARRPESWRSERGLADKERPHSGALTPAGCLSQRAPLGQEAEQPYSGALASTQSCFLSVCGLRAWEQLASAIAAAAAAPGVLRWDSSIADV